jgi:hypothetical protein
MRLRALRTLILFFAVPLLTGAVSAQEAVTRLSPVPLVPFRGVALSRDMNLREAPPVSPPAATTSIIRPGVVKPISAPTSTISRIALPAPPPLQLSTPPALRKATPPALAKTTPPKPAPPRSALPARSEPPLSALPPGGRDIALQPTTFTPYDRYMGSVRAVISNLEIHESSMVLAARLMKTGRRFKYCVSDPYRADPPTVTEARKAGDCKSKALWLYDNLGDSNALFVIGKAEKRARNSHAWVYWRYDDRWWILDCTERSDPIAADSVSADRYVPYYSFGKSGAYRHKATRLILTGGLPTAPKPVAALR